MRYLVLLCALATATTSEAAQGARADGPKKGDTISVKGCLSGTALEATELVSGEEDGGGELPLGVTFRLTGDKSLLKKLRQAHDRKLVSVSGVLKSDLREGNTRSGTFGGMRIRIGAPPSTNPAAPDAQSRRSLPVLEVREFQGGTTACGR